MPISINQIVIEPLHQLGGLCRRTLQVLCRPDTLNLDNTYKISANCISNINNVIQTIPFPTHSTINLCNLDLNDIPTLKAKEIFYIFLYTIPIFKEYLDHNQFMSLLVLGDIIFILSNKKKISHPEYNCLSDLINRFCNTYIGLFGTYQQTINYHRLRHILEQMQINNNESPMYSSSFPFESYLSKLGKFMHGSRGDLKQGIRNFKLYFYTEQSEEYVPKNLTKFCPSKKIKKKKIIPMHFIFLQKHFS